MNTIRNPRSAIRLLLALALGLLFTFFFITLIAAGEAWTTLASTPAGMRAGSALVRAENGYLYALRGYANIAYGYLYRYDPSGDSWTAMTSPPAGTYAGDMTYAKVGSTEYLYVLRGYGFDTFWRYDIAANSWITLTSTPADNRGALAWAGGNFLYALQGNNGQGFWRYDITNDRWDTLTNTLATVPTAGRDLVWTGGDYLYALRGNGYTDFWRYSISGNTWTSMASTPAAVGSGGALVWDGDDSIYAFQGSSTTVWRYSISGNSWSTDTSTPSAVGDGAALAVKDYYLYALRGGNTTDFWRLKPFSINADPAVRRIDFSATTTYIITVTSHLDFSSPVTLSVSGLPSGATHSFAPNPVTPPANGSVTSTLTITAPTSGTGGDYPLTITGVSGAYQDQTSVTLILPSNSVTVFPSSRTVARGSSDTYMVRVDNLVDYQPQVTLAASGLPSGASASFNPATVVPGKFALASTLAFIGPGSALAGTESSYLYALRGYASLNPSSLYRYDISADSWATVSSTPANTAYGDMTYAKVGSKEYLYILRGYSYDTFWRYDIAANSWITLTSTPASNRGALAWAGDYIYALQGEDQQGFWRYDITSNTWITLANTPDTVLSRGSDLVWTGGITSTPCGAKVTRTSGATPSVRVPGQA